ncbi:MAG TPA: hypothetical protein VG328_16175 [Stellaceae bacterium]|jgi:hypothetical protein|nr:hypothetical protein [Stellaceae bacterium]
MIAAGGICHVSTAGEAYWAYVNVLAGRNVTAVAWNLQPDPESLVRMNAQELEELSKPLRTSDLTSRLNEANEIVWSFVVTSAIPIAAVPAIGWVIYRTVLGLGWISPKKQMNRPGMSADPHDPKFTAWLRSLEPRQELVIRFALRTHFPTMRADKRKAPREAGLCHATTQE